ncbi:alpha/beta fold hydrolase [Novosphingobium beihaiensis]|uniref:Alpha/beta hydrolase n=1 Tax=Novosphingobium beihaiensis TaxID=2930389 RepID=A0ABT0BLI3_9SPHN|nr:alpha/beta hydrolase [Novosphingobium beihaiensis]MCJ2185820.1 alpha/beta hydrolase [Novosphingobium beihaiensis]
MASTVSERITPLSGYGSVTDVPRLPEGFADTFKSYSIDTGAVRLHAVIGGSGEPLLLHSGWPQNWYAWRYLMLPLSQHFTVIAVDPRGWGLSSKPADGYDADTLAGDMFALMDTLGHERFVMAGHDIGVQVGYAMAAARPERIRRLALGEGTIVGASPSPELVPDNRMMSDFLWHFNFNRAYDINERLVEGREDLFFNYQFETKAGTPDGVPKYARDFYIEMLRRIPGTLKASFDYYRAIDDTIPQIRRHKEKMVEIPVFTFAGGRACGPLVENEMRTLASNVESLIIPESGHFPAEEQPEALLAGLLGFLKA